MAVSLMVGLGAQHEEVSRAITAALIAAGMG
jgi:hypothetical protein